MGNCLELPKENDIRHSHMPSSTQQGADRPNHLQESPIILPFNNFTVRPDGIEETGRKEVPGPEYDVANLEVETVKMDNSYISGNTSQYSVGSKGTGRYIKRYRNEEEKLLDMLQEREKLLNSAIRQGQLLRAKCSRYQEELDNIREANRLDLNEQQWKRRYYEMDKKYRDIKEEVDVMVARNRNGRDFLQQQQDAIDSLNVELQREKIERQRLLSSSLTSLQSAGIGDKKRGQLLLTQLQIDNSLLQNRIQELTQRNARGREYLSKIEAEKREQDKLILQLKQQLFREKEEKENLLSRLGTNAGSPTAQKSSHVGAHDLYAKVNKTRSEPGLQASDVHSNSDGRSMGFDLEDDIHPVESERHFNVLSGVYDEVEILPLGHSNYGPSGDNASPLQRGVSEAKSNPYGSPTPQRTSETHPFDLPIKRRVSETDSMDSVDGKSNNELNAEAIIEQINVDTEETPRDISSFTPGTNSSTRDTYHGEENGVENDYLNQEESLTKF